MNKVLLYNSGIKLIYLSALFFSILIISSCINPPEYNETPALVFKSLSKSQVNENSDSVEITFSFTDGDGDLGPANNDDTTLDVFLTDSRDNSVKYYQLPYLTPAGNVKAISGETIITVGPLACAAGLDLDELTYSIQIMDRAGHLSNKISTSPINIDCQ